MSIPQQTPGCWGTFTGALSTTGNWLGTQASAVGRAIASAALKVAQWASLFFTAAGNFISPYIKMAKDTLAANKKEFILVGAALAIGAVAALAIRSCCCSSSSNSVEPAKA